MIFNNNDEAYAYYLNSIGSKLTRGYSFSRDAERRYGYEIELARPYSLEHELICPFVCKHYDYCYLKFEHEVIDGHTITDLDGVKHACTEQYVTLISDHTLFELENGHLISLAQLMYCEYEVNHDEA